MHQSTNKDIELLKACKQKIGTVVYEIASHYEPSGDTLKGTITELIQNSIQTQNCTFANS